MTRASALADRRYLDAHRFMYGELGGRVAGIAILLRDRLLRPGFVLPVIRLAPVAPYGGCAALSGNSGALSHVPGLDSGIWLYLHPTMYGDGGALLEQVDEIVLHELLHVELVQFDEDMKHKGSPWARRCQELSTRLDIPVRIERPRSLRRDGQVTTGTPKGCLSYRELAIWPQGLMAKGPPLRARVVVNGAL